MCWSAVMVALVIGACIGCVALALLAAGRGAQGGGCDER
jgi:uncharacterized membrane-anchored protein YhcB (DUF1043 family)